MTIKHISVYGSVNINKGEIRYFSDGYYPSVDSVKETIYRIIDELSEEGFVDIDLEYGHRDRKYNTRIYTIEFFVNDVFRGYMKIVV
jgi:hypothetical protein